MLLGVRWNKAHKDSWAAKAYLLVKSIKNPVGIGRVDYSTPNPGGEMHKIVYDALSARCKRRAYKQSAVGAAAMVFLVFLAAGGITSYAVIGFNPATMSAFAVANVALVGGGIITSVVVSTILTLRTSSLRLGPAYDDASWQSKVETEAARIERKGDAEAAKALRDAYNLIIEPPDSLDEESD